MLNIACRHEDYSPTELIVSKVDWTIWKPKYVTLTSSGLKNEGESRIFFHSEKEAWKKYNEALIAYLIDGWGGDNIDALIIRWRSRPKMESINEKHTEEKGQYSVYSRLYVYQEQEYVIGENGEGWK